MGISEILASVDREIAQLQQARAILSGDPAGEGRRPVGRPRKAEQSANHGADPGTAPRRRNLTPEGRKRIAEAVKRRWAAQKKAAANTK